VCRTYREAVRDHSPGLKAWAVLLNRFAVRSAFAPDLLVVGWGVYEFWPGIRIMPGDNRCTGLPCDLVELAD